MKKDCKSWYNDYVIAFRNPLDMLSTNVSKIVFDNIREEIGPFTVTVYPAQDTSLSKLNISSMKVNLIIEVLPNNAFLVGGSFDKDTKWLEVNVKIDKNNFSESFYNNLYIGIREAIRHELEHARFQVDNPSHNPNYIVDEKFDRLPSEEKIKVTTNYLNDLSETDSIIRQCMTNAKFKKSNFLSVLSSMIWYFLYTRAGINYSIVDVKNNRRLGNEEARNMLIRFNQILSRYKERAFVIYPELNRGK